MDDNLTILAVYVRRTYFMHYKSYYYLSLCNIVNCSTSIFLQIILVSMLCSM